MPYFMRFIRHGRTDFNEGLKASKNGDHSYFTSGKLTTDIAVELSSGGRDELYAARKNYVRYGFHRNFDKCIVSEMIRTHQTAQVFGFEPDWVEPLTNERSWGRLGRLPYNERGNCDEAYDADPVYWTPLGGESKYDVLKNRIKPLCENLSHDHSGKDLLFVSHGDFTRVMIMNMLNLSSEQFAAFWKSDDPILKVHNGQMVDFSHYDPVTGKVDQRSLWFRSVALTDPTLSEATNDWRKIY